MSTAIVNERAALVGIGPGRPAKQPPVDAPGRIADLAADGWSIVGIASKLGVAQDTFRRWIREYRDLQDAFEFGRERERQLLHNEVFRIATEAKADKDRLLAAMYLLNSRHGYRQDHPQDGTSRVNVTINLPGALSRDDFMKTVVSDERDG